MYSLIPIATAQVRGGDAYDITLNLADPEHPIIMGEGCGLNAASGSVALADLLQPQWDKHLNYCRCEWLRELAGEEMKVGRKLTPAEILARWEAVKPPES
jgi:hypothetical protein